MYLAHLVQVATLRAALGGVQMLVAELVVRHLHAGFRIAVRVRFGCLFQNNCWVVHSSYVTCSQ